MLNTHGDHAAQQPATWRNRDEERRRGPWPAVTRAALTGVAAALADSEPDIDAVFLFGSYASGRIHQGSDVDLAILLRTPPRVEEVVSRQLEMARFCEDRLGLPVDVVLIHPDLRATLLFDIFRIEVILFACDRERAHRIACRYRAEYRDLLPRAERAFALVERRIAERFHALDRSGA